MSGWGKKKKAKNDWAEGRHKLATPFRLILGRREGRSLWPGCEALNGTSGRLGSVDPRKSVLVFSPNFLRAINVGGIRRIQGRPKSSECNMHADLSSLSTEAIGTSGTGVEDRRRRRRWRKVDARGSKLRLVLSCICSTRPLGSIHPVMHARLVTKYRRSGDKRSQERSVSYRHG